MSIKKEIDSYTGSVKYYKCTGCGRVTNFDMVECPDCGEEEK